MASVWLPRLPLVLASTSPTRRLLLEAAGIVPETRSPGIDERAVEASCRGLAPAGLALHLAEAKAVAVSSELPGRIVVGADQVLERDGTLLHKPADLNSAREQIALLSGRTHVLHAAVSLAEDGRVTDGFVVEARLTMRTLDPSAIATYVALAGETRVTASVGGYQLEGLGVHLFDAVAGDHSTILGLPLGPLLARLRARGLLAF